MKKFAYILSICFIACLFAGGAMAGETTLTTTSNTIASQSASGYPPLDDVVVSPNVELSVFVAGTQDSFEIIGFNTKGNIEYGVDSTTSYIYFAAAADDQTTVTVATGTVSDGWATMGVASGSGT